MAVSKVHLDTLPIELQIKILKLLSDVSILYSLVHASPAYHSVYAANREVILTNVTFNELQGRSIDILEPTSFAQVRVWKDKFSLFLQPAIVAAREQHESGNPIKLEVYQCIALRTVVIWVGWSVEEDWAERQTTPLADSIGSLLEVFFNLPIVKASPKGKQKSGLAPGRLLPHQRLLPGEEPTAYMARIGMRGKVPELHLLNFGPYTIDEITLMILLADTDDEGLDGICEEMFLGLSLAAAHAR